MEIHWLTAFIDLPPDRFDAGSTFWLAVTESRPSEPRGDQQQFTTLIPPAGDPYLRIQRTSEGPRIHLDLHVDSPSAARERAEALGATLDVDLGHVVMRSPSGLTFCFVSGSGETERPPPAHQGCEHRLDQICIDIPASRFDEEVRFWADLTGLETSRSKRQEFVALDQPPSLPLRVLLQRLGEEDGAEMSRAHLDLACGEQVEEVRRLHERLGAEFVADGTVWTTMRDPAGMLYCLTQRNLETGRITEQA